MTRTARSTTALALAVVVAAALAGCAGTNEPGSTPSSATTEAPMSPAPAPSETATAAPTQAPAGANTIATPADGSTVTGPQVAVTGAGTGFEGTLRWRVLTAGTTTVVTEDFTTAGANGEVGPFAFTVELTPGTYTLEVWEPDAADAGTESDASRHALVASTFTVA